ncbi:hypothetical protein LGH82_19065 [Mesorhizobium sp. PAMC28654]|uniref:hypothetical protein n=1 Tax=Mesorhizobium sp. PAMC28654 TaxID=2880934 RepID=UPI001D09EBC2|nr:hypothetical protein [Mesorhizobium sp. PAMC28654]UDL87296.1 hypothetical protein LGH82_19065 [Mesorhizobium sp. PAMC28654]
MGGFFPESRSTPFLISFLLFLFLAFCYSPANAENSISQIVPLIKQEYPGKPPHIRMLYVNILSLGTRKINQPILLDTGSSGMTIDCAAVLPRKLCSAEGVHITKTLELDGIFVTTQKVVMNYGIYDEYGNVALARVTFGSPHSPVATDRLVPFLIRYKTVKRSTGEIVGGRLWPKGIFGVSPIGGGGPNRMLKSPIDAVSAGNGLRKGYYLSPIGTDWRICANEDANCPTVEAFHIGISESVKSDFNTQKWMAASNRYNFPTIDSCILLKEITTCRPTVYDTGNSTILLADNLPKDSDGSMGVGTKVAVKIAMLGEWKFDTSYASELEFSPTIGHSIVGIRYFETNSLLVDLDAKEIGIRIGH